MDIDITKGPQGEDEMFDDFNIYKDRHFPLWDCDEYTALRDIQAGEELLDNYLTYGGVDFWEVNVLGLQEVCSGGIGLVSLYEKQEESQQE